MSMRGGRFRISHRHVNVKGNRFPIMENDPLHRIRSRPEEKKKEIAQFEGAEKSENRPMQIPIPTKASLFLHACKGQTIAQRPIAKEGQSCQNGAFFILLSPLLHTGMGKRSESGTDQLEC